MTFRLERFQDTRNWQFTFGQEVAKAKGITADFAFRLFKLVEKYGQTDKQSDTRGPKPTKLEMAGEKGHPIFVNLGEGSLAVLTDASFGNGTPDVIRTTTGFCIIWDKDLTTQKVTKAMEKFGADLAKANP